jgi:hypothetical protein
MLLNGFTGRTVSQVERQGESLKIQFTDGGYLYVRALGPAPTNLKISCMCTRCAPSQCESCRGIENAASE